MESHVLTAVDPPLRTPYVRQSKRTHAEITGGALTNIMCVHRSVTHFTLGILFLFLLCFSDHTIYSSEASEALHFPDLLTCKQSFPWCCITKGTDLSLCFAWVIVRSASCLSLEDFLFSIRAVPQMLLFHSGFPLCHENVPIIKTENMSLMKRRQY